jgi:hypothetical protein
VRRSIGFRQSGSAWFNKADFENRKEKGATILFSTSTAATQMRAVRRERGGLIAPWITQVRKTFCYISDES